jgi:hypothetical protein
MKMAGSGERLLLMTPLLWRASVTPHALSQNEPSASGGDTLTSILLRKGLPRPEEAKRIEAPPNNAFRDSSSLASVLLAKRIRSASEYEQIVGSPHPQAQSAAGGSRERWRCRPARSQPAQSGDKQNRLIQPERRGPFRICGAGIASLRRTRNSSVRRSTNGWFAATLSGWKRSNPERRSDFAARCIAKRSQRYGF